jgi:MOSC domain-containing protein YiiM
MPGTVRALFVKPEKDATPVSVASVEATPTGLDGDYHSRRMARRQILLISGTVLSELDVEPGAVDENVVVDDLDVMSLTEGQQLRLGEALVAVTIPCEPCVRMDRIRHGLKEALKGRRGMFVRVVAPGAVRVGDPVVLFDQESRAEGSGD